jgi:hypothetical protein
MSIVILLHGKIVISKFLVPHLGVWFLAGIHYRISIGFVLSCVWQTFFHISWARLFSHGNIYQM